MNGQLCEVAPAWFDAAVAHAPERTRFESAGAEIELLTWGERGRPGVLLLHGNGAHADWWRWTAPLLARDRRVAAISLSGMGGSARRDQYSVAHYAGEARDAIDAAGLAESGAAPFIVGHSFGGVPAAACTARYPDAVSGLVLVDTFAIAKPRPPQPEKDGMPVYASREEAMARFRLMPRQEAPPYVTRFIAEHSLMPAPGGWTWRFDPKIWRQLDISSFSEALSSVTRPMACLYGEHSVLGDAEQRAAMRRLAPAAFQVEIPDAAHHIMADQPLALVAALRAILAGWDAR
ncbi:alpha/beta fold hydrolase [Sphingomonas soli]|uniref:alpha/beta fold hydrolase n=1 Tax=Sphingomonas soli TaxID=266127 RepID=UPI00082C495B|nr:alpha/beta hydrolase [Sphingomonas soli]